VALLLLTRAPSNGSAVLSGADLPKPDHNVTAAAYASFRRINKGDA